MKIEVTKAMDVFDAEIIEEYRDKTAWFNPDNPISRRATYEAFRHKCGFGNAESLILVAALGMIGASFEDDVIVMDEV